MGSNLGWGAGRDWWETAQQPLGNTPQNHTGRNHHNWDNELTKPVQQQVRQLASMMAHTTPFAPWQAELFLALANQVLDSDSIECKQQLIHELATTGGLHRVVHFMGAIYRSDSTNISTLSFWHHCVPFLKIISHEDLCSSLLLESLVETVYNTINGDSYSGRAIPFLRSVIDHLTATNTNIRQSPEFQDALCATCRTLWMTLKVNKSACLQKGIVDIAQNLRKCFPVDGTGYTVRVADMELRQVEQKLNIAETRRRPAAQFYPRSTAIQQASQASVADHDKIDFPGDLSMHGSRHDNDKASILDIKILPTQEEVMCMTRTDYLPMRDYDPSVHHLAPGIHRVLDTQFRLLREDTSGLLRDAIRYLVNSLGKNPARDPNKGVMDATGTQTVIYRNAMFEALNMSDRGGLQLAVSFDQPARLVNNRVDAAERGRWWSQSRFMQEGCLICLVDQHKEFTFFTISERIVTAEGQNNGGRQFDTVRDLSSHPTRALITLKFIDLRKDLETVIDEYHRHTRYHGGYPLPYLVEFPGLLFASFAPILEFLQEIVHVAGGAVPFQRWIAPEGQMGQNHLVEDPANPGTIKVPPPAYMSPGVIIDLSVIANASGSGQLTHSIEKPCSIPDLQRLTSLDKGQCEALLLGLTRELALIQGPPGTGKSFVGVQLVKVLLHNRAQLKLGPIICVYVCI